MILLYYTTLHLWLHPCITICIDSILFITGLKELQIYLEEKILDEEDDYNDRAEYERENDVKRYRNKLLHNIVLVGG